MRNAILGKSTQKVCKTNMTSQFRNIVWISLQNCWKLEMQVFSFAWDAVLVKEEILQELLVYFRQSVDYRKRESNHRKHHIKFPYVYSVFGSVSLAASNLNDKEGGNSPSSLLASQSFSLSISPRKAKCKWALHETRSWEKELRGAHETWVSKLHCEKETGVWKLYWRKRTTL